MEPVQCDPYCLWKQSIAKMRSFSLFIWRLIGDLVVQNEFGAKMTEKQQMLWMVTRILIVAAATAAMALW